MKFVLISIFICILFVDAKKLLLVSLDGFRHDMLKVAAEKNKNVASFLEIRDNGIQGDVMPVFPTLTFPTHFGIATGRNVESHGLMANSFYDPIKYQRYKMGDAKIQLDPTWLEYGKNEPIWLTNQRHGNRSCVFYFPGSTPSYFGKYPFSTFGLYADLPDFRSRVDRVIEWISRDEFTFCALYFNEPDHTGHTYGPDSMEYINMVETMNNGIAYLLDRIKSNAALKDNLNLIVTSDHGLAQIPPENRVKFYTSYNTNQFNGSFSPGVFLLFPKNASDADLIYENLKNNPQIKNVTIYKKADIPERLKFRKSYRAPPILFLADSGFLIQNGENEHIKNAARGMHGYDNKIPDMHPIFLACGPDIKKIDGIQKLNQIDIYPLITGILGIDAPNKIDGRLARIAHFMKKKPSDKFMTTWLNYATGISIPH